MRGAFRQVKAIRQLTEREAARLLRQRFNQRETTIDGCDHRLACPLQQCSTLECCSISGDRGTKVNPRLGRASSTYWEELAMSLAGHGAVAIWNDIAPEGRAIFYAWHGVEHVPERVGIPGFLRGRRYVAIHGNPEYFTLYETESPQVLTGQDYANRLNRPTPWTSDAIRHFRNVARSLCRVAVSHGHAQGGLIATWRYDVPDHEIERH